MKMHGVRLGVDKVGKARDILLPLDGCIGVRFIDKYGREISVEPCGEDISVVERAGLHISIVPVAANAVRICRGGE